MQKNEIKNFICSFLLSLLAVVAVGKAFFYTSKQPIDSSIKENIPVKTISLFREKAISTSSLEAEAIDLSAIDHLIAEPQVPALENDSPVLEVAKIEQAPLVENKEIQIASSISAVPNPINTDLAAATEIKLDALSEPTYEENMDISSAIVALSSIAQDETTEQISHEVVYSPEENAEATEAPIILAEAESVYQPEDILIPLEESSEVLHESIDVLQSASVSQIAMLEPNSFAQSIDTAENFEPEETQILVEADLKQKGWQQMSAQTDDDPWVVAKGNKFAKNKAVVEQYANTPEPQTLTESGTIAEEAPIEESVETQEDLNLSQVIEQSTEVLATENIQEALAPKPLLRPIEDETKLAYQMIENLLIPIPEDIKNDADLTPDLSVTPKTKAPENIQNTYKPQPQPVKEAVKETIPSQAQLSDQDKENGLFKNIASWFSSKPEENNAKSAETSKKNKKKNKKRGFDMTFFQNTGNNSADEDQPMIMPAELRLSFQPNRAEISGQTLRWIHAFADNARDSDGVYVEIRIDGTSSFALQQKRLNLLSTILANRGVDFRKINIVFTSREPNSLIIRNIRFGNDDNQKAKQNKNNSYYQPW